MKNYYENLPEAVHDALQEFPELIRMHRLGKSGTGALVTKVMGATHGRIEPKVVYDAITSALSDLGPLPGVEPENL